GRLVDGVGRARKVTKRGGRAGRAGRESFPNSRPRRARPGGRGPAGAARRARPGGRGPRGLAVELLAGGLGVAHPAALARLRVLDALAADARRLAVAVERQHVRSVDGHLLLDAPTLRVRLVRLGVADADVDALDDDALGLGVHLEHAARVALRPVHPELL